VAREHGRKHLGVGSSLQQAVGRELVYCHRDIPPSWKSTASDISAHQDNQGGLYWNGGPEPTQVLSRVMHRELDGWVIANLFLILFIGVADHQIIAPLLPAIAASLDVSVSATGLLVVVYSLAAAGAALLAGAWSDRSGRQVFLTVALLVFSLSAFATSYTAHLRWLLLCRALTGMAAGVLSACSIAYAGDYFAYAVRGKALGYISMANAAAMVVAVPVAAYVADHLGWQKNFLGLSVAGLVVIALNIIYMPKILPQSLEEEPPSTGEPNSVRPGWMPAGSMRGLLWRPEIIACMVIAFGVSGGIAGTITYAGAWLHVQFELTTRTIGLVFLAGGLLALVGAALGGAVSDRYAKKSVAIASSVLLALAIVLLPLLPWSGLLVAVFGLANFAAAFRQGPVTALMTELVPRRGRGTFIAMRNMASQIGIATTAFLGSILFERFGYGGVGVFCAALTLVVILLLTTQIQEPVGRSRPDPKRDTGLIGNS
jgi:MFS transporter, DHA1 family, inner membrane transport protein